MPVRILTIASLCAALGIIGCGSSELSTVAETERPKPEVPQGPTSKKLIVRDLEEGSGVVAEDGDELGVHYVAGIYETGEEIESAWVPDYYLGQELGSGSWIPGWEKGMKGMRVGGRRELIIPTSPDVVPPGSELGDTLVYIVDLLEVEKPKG